jgi:hypothetical protein
MGELRLKGQEIQIQATAGGALVDALTAVASFSDTMKMRKLEEGFLGEVTNRHDSVFDGWDGGFEMQVHSSAWMTLQAQVQAKAKPAGTSAATRRTTTRAATRRRCPSPARRSRLAIVPPLSSRRGGRHLDHYERERSR